MNRVISSLLAAAAVLPIMWYAVVPPELAKEYCKTDGNGKRVVYTVTRQDKLNNDVVLEFQSACRDGFCKTAGL